MSSPPVTQKQHGDLSRAAFGLLIGLCLIKKGCNFFVRNSFIYSRKRMVDKKCNKMYEVSGTLLVIVIITQVF